MTHLAPGACRFNGTIQVGGGNPEPVNCKDGDISIDPEKHCFILALPFGGEACTVSLRLGPSPLISGVHNIEVHATYEGSVYSGSAPIDVLQVDSVHIVEDCEVILTAPDSSTLLLGGSVAWRPR